MKKDYKPILTQNKTKMTNIRIEALRIVREFQKKYRSTIPDKTSLDYTWESNPNSVGQLQQRSCSEGFQSVL